MSPTAPPDQRLEALFEELAELAGQRNAIDGRIVEIVAEMDRDELWGATGARSVPALVAWKLGVSSGNAHTIAAVADRLDEFPRCAQGMREGRLSLDQVGVIAALAGEGSDEHYAELAAVATVNQLRTAVKLEPRPDPELRPPLQRSVSKTCGEQSTSWRITLPHDEAATFDAALQSHLDAMISEWRNDHGSRESGTDDLPPMPDTVDAFLRLVEAGWDAEATRRPHGQRTTVVVHVDVEKRNGALHLGPLLTDADRRYLTCDATCEAWFERDRTSAPAGRPARSTGDCAAHWSTATRPVRSTTGRTTAASSPSPGPPTGWSSPTAPIERSVRERWHVPPLRLRPPSRRAPDRPANVPTGGGTSRSGRRDRRRTSPTWRPRTPEHPAT